MSWPHFLLNKFLFFQRTDDHAATPLAATSATDDYAMIVDDISDINTVVNSLPVLQSNYGFAGKNFIKFVVNLIKRDGEERLKADHERMKAELKPYDSHKGKLNEVAVIALADYYASLSVFAKPAASYSSASYSAIDTDVDTEADKTADEDKAINVNEAVAWREAVQLGRWILLSAIDNPVVLK